MQSANVNILYVFIRPTVKGGRAGFGRRPAPGAGIRKSGQQNPAQHAGRDLIFCPRIKGCVKRRVPRLPASFFFLNDPLVFGMIRFFYCDRQGRTAVQCVKIIYFGIPVFIVYLTILLEKGRADVGSAVCV